MYCLRLLSYKNYIAYYNVYNDYIGVLFEMYESTKFCLNWLLFQYGCNVNPTTNRNHFQICSQTSLEALYQQPKNH